MKIGIFTFYFAQNYGAMLQAYALKRYLKEENIDAKFINYEPETTRVLYSVNPFVYGMHPKIIVKRFGQIFKKLNLKIKFKAFIRYELEEDKKTFSDVQKLSKELERYDFLIYGSDQIWNLNLTGEDAEYYGKYASSNNIKIAYAGSFGSDQLTKRQAEFVHKYMSTFNAVSVREECGVKMLEECGISATHVCDPVFLINSEEWIQLCSKVKIKIEGQYILYYGLKEDSRLIERTQQLARKYKYKIVSVHPNADKVCIGKQLYNVGPLEFLWLVKNAEFICTNSFHATAFSVIFRKKIVHISFEKKQGRVESLFKSLDLQEHINSEKAEWIDLKEINREKYEKFVADSKQFLNEALLNER